RFVDADGGPVAAPPPFALAAGEAAAPWPHRDVAGRALADEGGGLLYEYVDLDRSVLAALARDRLELVHPERGVARGLVAGAAQLSGPRAAASRGYADGSELAYAGFDTAASPLLDLLYAHLVLLADARADGALAAAAALLRDHEPAVARLAAAVIGA